MPEKPRKAKPLNFSSQRPKEDRSHYGTLHQKLRLQVLAERPVCEVCQKAFATQAHHKKYPALSTADYQALCAECHKAQHKG